MSALKIAIWSMDWSFCSQSEIGWSQETTVLCVEKRMFFPLDDAYPTDEFEIAPCDLKEVRCPLCRKRHALLSMREAVGWGLLKVDPDAALTTAERKKKWAGRLRAEEGQRDERQDGSPLSLAPPPAS